MIRIKSNNAIERALAKKKRLENALIAAIDASRLDEAEYIAAELQELGLLPSPEVVVMIRDAVAAEERVLARRQKRQNKHRKHA
jgi:hypothetical protein